MLYLANPSNHAVRAAMTRGELGAILTPGQRLTIPAGAVACADNGCYGKGYPGDDAWWAWLLTLPLPPRILFAVAPDVVGDAAATLRRSAPWLPRIRSAGHRAAFVAQDGLEDLTVPWAEFDVLFLGGTTRWKLGAPARAITRDAIDGGIPVHMGRVNSWRRIRYADAIGCRTVDGTLLTHGPGKHLPRLLRWCDEVRTQAPLFTVNHDRTEQRP